MNNYKPQNHKTQLDFHFAGINPICAECALPNPPARPLKGIVDICPECCAPLDFSGIHIVNDDSLKIVKILCCECYETEVNS